jgi:hypothetical protein
LFDAENQWFSLPKQRFHALWQPDFGLKHAFSGAKYASEAIRICASSYEIRSATRRSQRLALHTGWMRQRAFSAGAA